LTIHDLASACKRAEALCNELELEVLEQKDIPYGRQFKVRFGGETAGFNVYYGKKGLNLVAQGSDNAAKQAVEALFIAMRGGSVVKQSKPSNAGEGVGKKFPSIKATEDVQVAYDEPWIGTDESGKGDFFGPLITAGVIVDPEAVPLLQALGVDDSKKITDAKIPSMAAEIRKICYGKYKLLPLVPAKYNDLYRRISEQGKTLNHLLAWAHATVLENLLEKQFVNLAVADQFANERYIINQLKGLGKQIKLIQVPRAEQNIAVAAASVLARDALITWHNDMKRETGISLPKGATNVIKPGKDYVRKMGKDALVNVAKLHFKTTQDVLK
jgi:ribonuclease HIII